MLSSVFSSIVVRSIYALVTAFLICIILTPWVIGRLKAMQIGQQVREQGVQSHRSAKQGIPTMGGIVILVSILIATIFWAKFTPYTVPVLASLVWLGLIGFVDDFQKVAKRKSDGITAVAKILGQAGFAAALALYLYQSQAFSKSVFVPLVRGDWALGLGYVAFVMVVVIGSSNAVNLTDGLDGLATGVLMWVALAYCGIAYVAGRSDFSHHLAIPYCPGAGELSVACAAMVGACVGFLWYNTHPAEVFMGDTGSLALGGAVGTVAVLTRQELLLVIIGGIFVVEALSVMVQVGSFKLRGKRVFKMAPIHHHFELLGWAEPKVVIRFWILTIMLALLGLSLLGLNGMVTGHVMGG
ncbi:MAG: phospho-N-acetylmuramoyl-pentapeptide-transferase [Candidatus Riflebacteria bacterium]|nr:phospho-N-acetylmuramoyl-pentapeptide-transferase [Candidatus Riflebacteria bacterium]